MILRSPRVDTSIAGNVSIRADTVEVRSTMIQGVSTTILAILASSAGPGASSTGRGSKSAPAGGSSNRVGQAREASLRRQAGVKNVRGRPPPGSPETARGGGPPFRRPHELVTSMSVTLAGHGPSRIEASGAVFRGYTTTVTYRLFFDPFTLASPLPEGEGIEVGSSLSEGQSGETWWRLAAHRRKRCRPTRSPGPG